jgi:hypothetical protein
VCAPYLVCLQHQPVCMTRLAPDDGVLQPPRLRASRLRPRRARQARGAGAEVVFGAVHSVGETGPDQVGDANHPVANTMAEPESPIMAAPSQSRFGPHSRPIIKLAWVLWFRRGYRLVERAVGCCCVWGVYSSQRARVPPKGAGAPRDVAPKESTG